MDNRLVAAGTGWSVRDFRCTAGPGDRVIEERHGGCCIAAVTAGSFQYRTQTGTALMAPGGLLLGNEGACFECSHDHAVGDRCLAFHYEPAVIESVAAAIPGVASTRFDRPRLPPGPALQRLIVAAERAQEDGGRLEELALDIAATALSLTRDAPVPAAAPTTRDVRRVTTALRLIECDPGAEWTLARLADETATSRFHFLRVFRQVVGTTPYRYVLRTRLHRAALALRHTRDTVTAVALDCGFDDLSTFNRHFRRSFGTSPSGFRRNPRG